MKQEVQNIYQRCRMIAGLSQENAAERIAISVRQLSNYETGKAIPPDDIVYLMALAYGSNRVLLEHMKKNNCFNVLVKTQGQMSVEKAVLLYEKEISEAIKRIPELVNIVIMENSESAVKRMSERIKDMIGVAIEVVVCINEKGH